MRSEDPLGEAIELARAHVCFELAVPGRSVENGEPADKIGCVRDFRLRNGDRLSEQLLGLSDYEMFCTYSILETPKPLTDYVATFRVTPVTDGNRTFWRWESTFSTPPGMERQLHELGAQGVYEAGFANLRRHLQLGFDVQPQRNEVTPIGMTVPAIPERFTEMNMDTATTKAKAAECQKRPTVPTTTAQTAPDRQSPSGRSSTR